jgi:hypothetical protein
MGQAPRRRSLPAGVRDRTTPDCDGERRASLSGRPICEAAGALCCIPAAPQDRVGGGNDPARRSGSQRTAVSDARPRLVPTAIARGEVSQSPPRTRTHSPRALFSADVPGRSGRQCPMLARGLSQQQSPVAKSANLRPELGLIPRGRFFRLSLRNQSTRRT